MAIVYTDKHGNNIEIGDYICIPKICMVKVECLPACGIAVDVSNCKGGTSQIELSSLKSNFRKIGNTRGEVILLSPLPSKNRKMRSGYIPGILHLRVHINENQPTMTKQLTRDLPLSFNRFCEAY